MVHLTSRCFVGLGIKTDEKIGMYAPNCEEWIFSQLASSKVGGVFVNINPGYQSKDLAYTLNKTEINTLIMPKRLKKSNYVEILNGIDSGFKDKSQNPLNLNIKSLPFLKNVILLDDISADEDIDLNHNKIGKFLTILNNNI